MFLAYVLAGIVSGMATFSACLAMGQTLGVAVLAYVAISVGVAASSVLICALMSVLRRRAPPHLNQQA